ncbi:hypothetical protein B5M09_009200 [Aphanomyces astaci]|uniref:DDE-1 domain-containing protein n=1 Tax=Aphanomyces astaci TaxID=112090 RepID=A0A3R7Y622_APHAT|nr:hypothetical protein B5M09_009200 [Aphanomyces astaci]
MDETSFFYCLSPHRSITRHRVRGTKKSKKRITLALITNADGSDVIDPLFIGTAVQPRCFNHQTGQELGFDYHASKKAWMNGNIFNTYLHALNDRMVSANRKVLMLVDNAPPHKPKDEALLTNVSLKMLPPNTTAYLQPQDAGIIVSFKAKVKQRQLQNALDQIEEVMSGRQDKLYEYIAHTIGIPASTLQDYYKRGLVVKYNPHIIPKLTDVNKVVHVKWAMDFVRPDSNFQFADIYDYVHVDEKWFHATKVKSQMYLLPGEIPPHR